MPSDPQRAIDRIERALDRVAPILTEMWSRRADLEVESKDGAGPVSEADRRADEILRETLPEPGEGWLSEETVDRPRERLAHDLVWVVDPLDGTKEFLAGIPEWSVSIGLVERGVPVAGGVMNPAAGVSVVGAVGVGVRRTGAVAAGVPDSDASVPTVLASRSEMKRGLWDSALATGLQVKAVGSVAWKLALVAAGDADATWTHVPKSLWDIAGGFALITAAGGRTAAPDRSDIRFDASSPIVPGAVGLGRAASSSGVLDALAFRGT